jgi:hypothetical protein
VGSIPIARSRFHQFKRITIYYSNALRSTIAHSSEDRSPDAEVIEIATRRQFPASEKRMLLAEAAGVL